jgi:hypothetical protein
VLFANQHLKGGETTMKKWIAIMCAIFMVALIMSCSGEELPDKFEVPLAAGEGYEGPAKGKAVIDTVKGTNVSLEITGLQPGEVYTCYFVNVKSKMFDGLGEEPYVLPVDQSGAVKADLNIKKDIYKKYTKLGIFLNPDKQPVGNPLGVKAKLGAIMKQKKPKMVLVGKLR